jgi:uncharacterized protein
MASFKTPGVYVQEIPTLPPSVAEVATAIPAFIGYTSVGRRVAFINNLLEYETLFGRANPSQFVVTTRVNPQTNLEEVATITREAPDNEYLMYYAVSHYFQNGGGRCCIVSVGDYAAAPATADFEWGLGELEKEDEPTLIVLTDAVVNLPAEDYYALCQAALGQCNKLKDRFAIFDLRDVDNIENAVEEFRDGIGINNLKYGAAYYPYLLTTLVYQYYDEAQVTIQGDTPAASQTLAAIASNKTVLYNQIKTQLNQQRVILPPSAAIAGVYASVDRDRGVWKAPANVSLNAVIGPVRKITNEEQEGLNVDPTAGKSINAIRAFTGKGTLVWGARTLAGNDNEWRYVNVRRLFNLIEESAQKSTAFAVFEPNDSTTWLKVKAMIESYLYNLWEQGALAGSTPQAAYFVNIGLGKTMTTQDILEGRINVEIGIAAVRPAEFIVLKFSHKLQEA